MMRRVMVAAVIGLAVCTAASAALGQGAAKPKKPENTQAVDRLRVKRDELDVQLAGLMATTADPAGKNQFATALKISYRIVTRQLYDAADQVKPDDPRSQASVAAADQLRASITLKADTLAAGTASFDAMLEQLPKWQELASTAGGPAQQAVRAKATGAIASLVAFEKATEKTNQPLARPDDLRKYLLTMIKPLEGAVSVELGDQSMPVAWPVPPQAPVRETELPRIDQVLADIQKANISTAVRRELQGILPKLAEQLADPAQAQAAKAWYRQILDCLALAERLASSQVLEFQAREALSQQVLVSLILFRDPRTRPAALARLEEVGNIAATLTELEATHLSASQKQVIAAAMQQAVGKLANAGTAESGRGTLRSLRELMVAYEQLVKTSEQTPPASIKAEWAKIRQTGDGLAAMGVEGVAAAMDAAKGDKKPADATSRPTARLTPEEATARLTRTRESLTRLATIPTMARAAEALKPGLEQTADRRGIVWARAIAAAPDVAPSGGTEKDAARDASREAVRDMGLYQRALTLLGELRQLLPNESTADLTRITAGQYDTVLKKYRLTEAKLLAALGTPVALPESLITQVETESRPLRLAAELANLLPMETSLGKLNGWGAWQLDATAIKSLERQLTLAVRAEFRPKDAAATDDPQEEPLVPLAQSGEILRLLARLTRRMSPLVGPAGSFAATYVQVIGTPEGTVLGDQADTLARICCLLNEAGCNDANDVPSAARSRLTEAVRLIGTLPR